MSGGRRWALLATLALALSLTTLLLAALAAPGLRSHFTDTITATGPSTALTPMEQALLRQIEGAVSSIDAAIYDFNRVSIRDALIAAHNRGVAVRIAADDDARTNPSYSPHFDALTAAGIPIVDDGRSSLMHNKFLVIDGQVVWTGSTNMSDNDFTFNHNNGLVVTSTQLAAVYTREFEEMFVDGLFGTAKSDNVSHTLSVDGVPVEVYFSPSDGAMSQVISRVQAAETKIAFAIFFFTEDALRDALIGRMGEGVAVSGVWDSLGASNQFSDDEALCDAGADIKIEDFGGKLHHKFMVIDPNGVDPMVVTGSMNWTGSGGNANDENTLIIHDAAVAQAYMGAYERLFDNLHPLTLCDVNSVTYLPVIIDP